ncbi:hypothetical protein HGRIS_008238 [Hohenbuehelia grisea]|uniref:Amidohydrolase-related domain-containing protein n=1 Tax=Hohenbuehelia grisea TaxID=104357 RepID=A0ABR3J7C9_9AGAR
MSSPDPTPEYPRLHRAAYSFPAIDNHAHPLLQPIHRSSDAFPFEGLMSEAQGEALKDAVHTLACFRATSELGVLYGLKNPTWDEIKSFRASLDYIELCKRCIAPTGIQCILIDDGLGGVQENAEAYQWHDQFTPDSTRRLVRVEIIAEEVLAEVLSLHLDVDHLEVSPILEEFSNKFTDVLSSFAQDPAVVGFKSIACYRTGLNIMTYIPLASMKFSLLDVFKMLKDEGKIRLAHKALNDHVVRLALEVAGKYQKPVQFHTGLGDNDISLANSSPAHMQQIIKAYPGTTFVLLHSSYPFTREAGYLTSAYPNVFLDFGEVFPMVSGAGQRAIIRQVLELCPTNKIMWSTDGHWWPETYYLGTTQARHALYVVLSEVIRDGELSEEAAIQVVENALFHNANTVYKLGLQAKTDILRQD